MYQNAYQSYRENEILTAEPLQLVQLLYQGALDAVDSARRHLGSGDIRSRSKAITKGFMIVGRLSSSLDHASGGELSGKLAALYDYIQRLLLDANAKQIEAPLIEAERLLRTLFEGWQASLSDGAAVRSLKDEGKPEMEYAALSYAF